jgi:hypothetical protein
MVEREVETFEAEAATLPDQFESLARDVRDKLPTD